MNFKLAREIYGLTPWMIDIHSIPVLTSILRDIRNKVKFEAAEGGIKCNTPEVYDPSQDARIITKPYGNEWFPGQLDNKDDFKGIGIINLNGPITKSGGASSVGMDQVSTLMHKMAEDERIIGFIILTDSGGGASGAVDIMRDTISEIKQEKPVYSLITKGGYAASAAYGIIASSSKIFSEAGMNIVGSIGTMISFSGFKANSTDKMGMKHVRLYATKSTMKNKGVEDALNSENYDLLVNDLLDPINEKFISQVKSDRPQLKNEKFDDGRTFFSKDVVGTFIDGIVSFSDVVQMIEQEYDGKNKKKTPKKGFNNQKSNINTQNEKMTKAEFQNAHPDIYNSIVQQGVDQERDRVGAWMAHVGTDSTAVAEGIKSGNSITQTEREAFFVKQNASKTAQNMVSESGEDVKPSESTTPVEEKPEANKDKAELEAAFNFDLT